jgi:hypothetical protein
MKFVTKKYDGDDQYSWAVFKAGDVKGMGSQIYWGDANPVVSGMSRSEAKHTKDRLNKG